MKVTLWVVLEFSDERILSARFDKSKNSNIITLTLRDSNLELPQDRS